MDKLNWQHIWGELEMERDNGGRWIAKSGSAAEEYIRENGYRTPSRAWPHSHAKACLTKKFAKWLRDSHPDLATKCGV